MTSASKRVSDENHLRGDSLYQFILRGRILLAAAWSGHRQLNLFLHLAVLLRMMARHLARLKQELLDEPSCRVNGHLAQWRKLGCIVTYAMITRHGWAEGFQEWSQRPGQRVSSGGINDHVSVTRRKILYWMLHLELIPYYA